VKRLLPALVLALLIHGLLLWKAPGWVSATLPYKPGVRVVTVSLNTYEPKTRKSRPDDSRMIPKKEGRSDHSFELKEEKEDHAEAADRSASVPSVHGTREAEPDYLANPRPQYPMLARKRGYQGVVVLNVLVDQTGMVADLNVGSSSGYTILDRAAFRSVKKWIFHPGMRGNQPVAMWVRIPVRFQLN
jgi:TonB family protein